MYILYFNVFVISIIVSGYSANTYPWFPASPPILDAYSSHLPNGFPTLETHYTATYDELGYSNFLSHVLLYFYCTYNNLCVLYKWHSN